jgi:hypothetical protein
MQSLKKKLNKKRAENLHNAFSTTKIISYRKLNIIHNSFNCSLELLVSYKLDTTFLENSNSNKLKKNQILQSYQECYNLH